MARSREFRSRNTLKASAAEPHRGFSQASGPRGCEPLVDDRCGVATANSSVRRRGPGHRTDFLRGTHRPPLAKPSGASGMFPGARGWERSCHEPRAGSTPRYARAELADVTVEVEDRVAVLRGIVDSPARQLELERRALSIDGVEEVENLVQLPSA